VSWSPHLCLIEIKQNTRTIESNSDSLYDKFVTLEGPDKYVDTLPPSSKYLISDLEKSCFNIAKHVQEVSCGNSIVRSLTLYFKLDKEEKLWLLFCSNVGLSKKKQIKEINSRLNFTPTFLFKLNIYPIEEDLADLARRMKVAKGKQLFDNNKPKICFHCFSQEVKLLKIEFRALFALSKRNPDEPIVKKIYEHFCGKDNEERIKILQQDSNLANSKINLCIDCFDLLPGNSLTVKGHSFLNQNLPVKNGHRLGCEPDIDLKQVMIDTMLDKLEIKPEMNINKSEEPLKTEKSKNKSRTSGFLSERKDNLILKTTQGFFRNNAIINLPIRILTSRKQGSAASKYERTCTTRNPVTSKNLEFSSPRNDAFRSSNFFTSTPCTNNEAFNSGPLKSVSEKTLFFKSGSFKKHPKKKVSFFRKMSSPNAIDSIREIKNQLLFYNFVT